jgi:hypothetical protein
LPVAGRGLPTAPKVSYECGRSNVVRSVNGVPQPRAVSASVDNRPWCALLGSNKGQDASDRKKRAMAVEVFDRLSLAGLLAESLKGRTLDDLAALVLGDPTRPIRATLKRLQAKSSGNPCSRILGAGHRSARHRAGSAARGTLEL